MEKIWIWRRKNKIMANNFNYNNVDISNSWDYHHKKNNDNYLILKNAVSIKVYK